MNKHHVKYLILLCSLLTLCGCGLVRNCKCDERAFKNSLKHTDLTPLTVAQLKHLLVEDTTHFKVVSFYSPCCGDSKETLHKIYHRLRAANDTSTLKIYVIQVDCGGLDYTVDVLNGLNIHPDTYYYLRDDTPPYNSHSKSYGNINFYLPMTNELFVNGSDISCGSEIAISFIVSPDNQLKKLRLIAEDNSYECVRPFRVQYLKDYDLTQLDFNVTDTLYLPIEYRELAIPDSILVNMF